MRKFLIGFIFLALLSGCGQGTSKVEKGKETKSDTTKQKEIKWVEPDQIYDLYSNPDKYIGYHVKLSGVYDWPTGLVNSSKQCDFNMTMDPVRREEIPTSTYVITDDTKLYNKIRQSGNAPQQTFVAVEGVVEGTITEKEAADFFGRPSLQVKASKVKIGEYLDLLSPTIETLEINQTKEVSGYKVTIEKIEFSPIENRVYVTITNNGEKPLRVGQRAFKAKQNGEKYYGLFSVYDGYQLLPDIVEQGQTVSGIALVDFFDYRKPWTLEDSGIENFDYDEVLLFEFEIPAVKE